jgi:hypothetical protein
MPTRNFRELLEAMPADRQRRIEKRFQKTHYVEQANQRAKDLQARIPRALSANYDHKTGRIVIHLSSKLIVSFLPADVEELKDARPSQLNKIEVSPSGFGIHFPALDADLYVPGLLEGLLGGRPKKAVEL